jgi:hypothetical protein
MFESEERSDEMGFLDTFLQERLCVLMMGSWYALVSFGGDVVWCVQF